MESRIMEGGNDVDGIDVLLEEACIFRITTMLVVLFIAAVCMATPGSDTLFS